MVANADGMGNVNVPAGILEKIVKFRGEGEAENIWNHGDENKEIGKPMQI